MFKRYCSVLALSLAWFTMLTHDLLPHHHHPAEHQHDQVQVEPAGHHHHHAEDNHHHSHHEFHGEGLTAKQDIDWTHLFTHLHPAGDQDAPCTLQSAPDSYPKQPVSVADLAYVSDSADLLEFAAGKNYPPPDPPEHQSSSIPVAALRGPPFFIA